MDIDDELEMLQRELMSVQEQKTNPLSERTVAQIMVKLHREGFHFYPTTDGNEYVTPDHLDNEILKLIRENGKINLTIFPQILNINIDKIEARINSLIQKQPIIRHNNNIFSTNFFKNLISNTKQILQVQGKIQLDSIAIQNELNIKFIEKLVQQNLQELNADLVGNELITNQYIQMKKARILGFLIAINNPINIDNLIKAMAIENKNVEEIILELIKQNRIKGKFQNSYYIPEKFTSNQKQNIIKFFQNNGYIQFDMLVKKYLVSRPQQWLPKNLKNEFIIFDEICFSPSKISDYSSQFNNLLKGQGFVEINQVIPFDLDEESVHNFMKEYCKIDNYFIAGNYCYSSQWLEKCTNEFKDKVIFDIFFKKVDKKSKEKKKGQKKQNNQITEQQLIQVLFNCGLAQYSIAQQLAPQLLPVLLQKLNQMKKKLEKEIASNKGFLNSTFLKYKSCKTIVRTQQSLARMVNIINKQQKKGERWVDLDFGINDKDKQGTVLHSKDWPNLETLKWTEITSKELLSPPNISSHYSTKKCLLPHLLELLVFHNKNSPYKLETPIIQQPTEQSKSPFIYKFYISEKDNRYVLVDNYVPFVQGKCFGSSGMYSLVQKAYSKLRYCYKAILSVGIQQLLFELTGNNSIKITTDNKEQTQKTVQEAVHNKNFVILLAQGQSSKTIKFQFEQKQSEFHCHRPYYLYSPSPNSWKLYPSACDLELPLSKIIELFKNVVIIEK